VNPVAPFGSILFERSSDRSERDDPSMFGDLNLDQVFSAVVAGRDEYELMPLFRCPLRDVRAVEYRHQVQRDLADEAVAQAVAEFADRMREMRKHLAQAGTLRYRYQKERWFLDATGIYCEAVVALNDALAVTGLRSPGFTAFRQYLAGYTGFPAFTGLVADIARVKRLLDDVRYCITIKGSRVRVTRYVRNDFRLDGPERIFVVTGPNHGGKTTFARTFGQLHYLASLGLPVPAAEAGLFLSDRVFTHFEREEDLATLRGKFGDELVRIRDVLEQATGDSVLVMNESFASTTLRDALFVGERVLDRMTGLGLLGVYVTFVDELASLNEACVSMVATVVPDNPAERTYELVRKPADGLAYAAAIAGKYGLSYRQLKERLAS